MEAPKLVTAALCRRCNNIHAEKWKHCSNCRATWKKYRSEKKDGNFTKCELVAIMKIDLSTIRKSRNPVVVGRFFKNYISAKEHCLSSLCEHDGLLEYCAKVELELPALVERYNKLVKAYRDIILELDDLGEFNFILIDDVDKN